MATSASLLSPSRSEHVAERMHCQEKLGFLIIIVTMAALTAFSALTSFFYLSPQLLGGIASSNILLGLSASITIGLLVIFCIKSCGKADQPKHA